MISAQVLNYWLVNVKFSSKQMQLKIKQLFLLFLEFFILTSCSSFKCSSYTFSMFLSLCPSSLTVSELQIGSFVCSSLKRLSSCSFSEVLLPLSNSTILSGPTGMYEEVDDRLSFSLASLEPWRMCSLMAWILSAESTPPTKGDIFFSEYLGD